MLGKNLNLLWSTFNALGQIFILAYGLLLTKYLPPGHNGHSLRCNNSCATVLNGWSDILGT